MFAKNAHLTDEKEIKAKLDLAEFIKKGERLQSIGSSRAEE